MTDENKEVLPEDIAPLPDGINRLSTKNVEGIEDNSRKMVTLISGEERVDFGDDNISFHLQNQSESILGLLADEFPEGTAIELSRQQVKQLSSWMKGRLSGYQISLQMLCVGDKCPYSNLCPIAKAGIPLPLMSPCPWEGALFKSRVAFLCNELKIDTTDPLYYIDYNAVRDLCGVELIMERVAMEISIEPENIREEVRGVDAATGQIVYGEEINKRYERLQTLQAQKLKLLESLSATRKEKIKTGSEVDKDPGTYLADLYAENKKKLMIEADVHVIETTEVPPTVKESLESIKGEGMTSIEIDDEPEIDV